MFSLFRYIRGVMRFWHICIGKLKLWSYQLQYSNRQVQWGANIVLNGNAFFRIKGRLLIGNRVVFNSLTRFNNVGINKTCSVFVREGSGLEIGSNTGFSGVSIVCYSSIKIGEYCNFGGNVSIWDTDFHPLNNLDRRVHKEDMIVSKPIVIGDDVFVGANSIILKGVSIGNRSIIGAGSVVTRDIPADEIWAGNPARFIRRL